MSFKAYEDFAEEPLALPVNGKTYIVPELGIDAGLKIAGVFAGTDTSLNKAPIEDAAKLLLGGLWDEMKADGVPLNAAMRVFYTVLADVQEGRAVAEGVWESGFDPKALAEFAERKANELNPPNRASRRSSNTGAARKTPSPASTSGTKPRKATPQRKP